MHTLPIATLALARMKPVVLTALALALALAAGPLGFVGGVGLHRMLQGERPAVLSMQAP